MGLSRLSKACRECPFQDTCENKKMEALAYLPMTAEVGMNAGMSASTIVYKDEIQKEIERSLGLYPSLFKELC